MKMGKDRERIIIVDDDPSVRRGLKRLFVSSGYEVEDFASARQFLDADMAHDRPSCLVLDVQLPDLTGLDLQRELLERGRDMPIVFITGHGDIPMSVEAMKLGAVDFLPKPVESEELIRAAREALLKDRELLALSIEQKEIRRRLDTLTPREFEVLRYVISGLLNKQAAYALGITEKTVKVHRARVMEKMGASSLVDLTRLADKGGVRPAVSDEM
jgi:FixJ family two-component response regulator